MRSISLRSLLIAAAVGAFALGLVTSLLGPESAAPSGTPSAASAPATTQAGVERPQVTALVVGVDSLTSVSPELIAVWLIAFRPPEPDVFLFGFRTDHPIDEGRTLAQALSEAGGDGSALVDAFGGLTPLPIDAVVVLDSAGFAAVVDFIGGVPAAEQPVDGAAVAEILLLLHSDPAASLPAQARILRALATQAHRLQPGTDLQPLLSLIPDHAHVSPSAQAGLTLIAPWLPLDPARIHISPDGTEAAP